MRLRTLVVDDEPVACRLLCSLVADVEWMELIGHSDRGALATRIIEEQEPDVVFLDIKLPDISGIEIAEAVHHRPHVVFTTAHDEYAIRALQLGAVDYLVKPFGRRRFVEAAERVRQRVDRADNGAPGGRDATHASVREPAKRVYVRDRGVVIPVLLERVDRIEAQGDYCLLCTGGRELLALVGIGKLEPMLDPHRFVRVHRSHIVNLDFVAAFRPFDARRYVVVMKNGLEITASAGGTRTLRGLIL